MEEKTKKWIKIGFGTIAVVIITIAVVGILSAGTRLIDDLELILPFDEDEIAYDGLFVFTPFGGQEFQAEYDGGSVVWTFEVKPGTILKAAESGRINIRKNVMYDNGIDPMDWEVQIKINYKTMIGYDHVIDLLVKDNDYVVQGQPLARASPSALRHKDPGETYGKDAKNVDEFEFGLVTGINPPYGVCPYIYMKDEEKAKLDRIIANIPEHGFEAPDAACLTTEKIKDTSTPTG